MWIKLEHQMVVYYIMNIKTVSSTGTALLTVSKVSMIQIFIPRWMSKKVYILDVQIA